MDTLVSTQRSRIAICIATYRRPQGLARVLDGIGALRFGRIAAPDVLVIISDNEASDAARQTVETFSARTGVATLYVSERRRGISEARNACLDAVPANAEFIAFLDDDERPHADWLEELLIGIAETGSDAITGPAMPVYEVPPPEWFRIGKFFASPRRKNSPKYADVNFLVMGNLLVRADFIRQNHIRFDSYFGLTGGEDRKFMLDMIGHGGRFTWTDSALVDHHVPKERICLRFVLRREFGVGCTRSALFRVDRSDVRERLSYAASVVWGLLWTVLTLPFVLLIRLLSKDPYKRLQPLFDLANASGRAYGLVGMQFKMYA